MLGYLKLKTVNEELYETDFLIGLKQKQSKLTMLQYWLCYIYYEVVVLIKYIANIITIKQIYDGYLFIFPFNLQTINANSHKMKICMKKMQKLIKRYNIHTLVLSEDLKEILKFENMPIGRQVHVLEGKGLMPYLIKETLEYILAKQDTTTQLEDLYVCMKEVKPMYIENISYLANYFRTINIVSPRINNFQKVAERIENKQNAIITVTNNRKKSLKKAKLIVNFDFTQNEMKEYSIYRNAIIMLIQENEQYEEVGFDGIQIKQIDIDTSSDIKELFQKYYLLDNYSLTTLYESIINKKQSLWQIKNKMQKDQVKIVKLYGSKGEIPEKEYTKIAS